MEKTKPIIKNAEQSKLTKLVKSIWGIADSRFDAMMGIFGSDNMTKELFGNPMWDENHLFKGKHKNKDIKKFATNFEDKGLVAGENKETWDGTRYDNLPPGEREFVTEVDSQLKKAQIVFKEHIGEISDHKDHYLDYIKKSADAIIQKLMLTKSFDDLITSDINVWHYGQYDTNGHRHKQYNGGLAGTDIPVPGVPDLHFHIMEGGHGATYSNNNDSGHIHLETSGEETGGPIWPEYSCKDKTETMDISKGITNIKDFVKKSRMKVMKLNAPKQIVIGALYIPFDENNPETVDTHGHACTKEEIENAAYEFMKQRNLGNVDLQHNFEKGYGYVVESYIAKDGDPDFIPGTWVVGVKVTDDNVWAQVVKGDIAGFSLAGAAYLREVA